MIFIGTHSAHKYVVLYFGFFKHFPETSSGIGIQQNGIKVCYVMLRSYTILMEMAQVLVLLIGK